MAQYPSTIKSFTNPTSANYLDDAGVLHATQHTDANDEIAAIETELGTTPKAPTLTTPAATADDVAELLGMILQQLENISGETNWYDAIGFNLANITTFGQSIIDDANEAAFKATVNLEIGTDVQAYDADLDTWATVTPASGIATFLATPSSANLATAVTDETGSGLLVFGTSPTITSPIITLANNSPLKALNAAAAEKNLINKNASDQTTIGENNVRATRFVPVTPKVLVLDGGSATTFTDVDVSANTTVRTYAVMITGHLVPSATARALDVRQNGSAEGGGGLTTRLVRTNVNGLIMQNTGVVEVDSNQIFEYLVTNAADAAYITLDGYWEYVD